MEVVSKTVTVLPISNVQLVDLEETKDLCKIVHACNNHHAQIVLWEKFLNHIMTNLPKLPKKMLKPKTNWP
jgi:hypothetical protein